MLCSNQNMKHNLKQKNIEYLASELQQVDWTVVYDHKNVNKSYDTFLETLKNKLDVCCPREPTGPKKLEQKHQPWMTSGLINACKKKNLLYRNFIKSRTPSNELRYKTYKNKLTKILKRCEREYNSRILNTHKNDAKLLWKFLNNIINRKSITRPLPKYFIKENNKITNDENIADGFNDFFTNIGPRLAEKINGSNKHFKEYLDKNTINSIYLDPASNEEILGIVSNLNNKHSLDKDGINASTVKTIITAVLEPIKHICNLSLSSGIFPDEMKVAKVIPLYKANDNKEFSNYRPVSLLPQFSKILEKIINNRIKRFITANNVLADEQYGFRDNHSTACALIDLVETLSNSFDKGNFGIGVFIDLKKAFDTVNHEILLEKIETYGIRGKALELIRSYLSKRKQYVV